MSNFFFNLDIQKPSFISENGEGVDGKDEKYGREGEFSPGIKDLIFSYAFTIGSLIT